MGSRMRVTLPRVCALGYHPSPNVPAPATPTGTRRERRTERRASASLLRLRFLRVPAGPLAEREMPSSGLAERVPFAWDDPPRVIAHRGAPREATENTIASFLAAVRAGARAVELD